MGGQKYINPGLPVYFSYAGNNNDSDNDLEGDVERLRELLEKNNIDYRDYKVPGKSCFSYRKGIVESEEEIGKGQIIIVVFSDKYLDVNYDNKTSLHCMYEWHCIVQNKNYKERVFPIFVGSIKKLLSNKIVIKDYKDSYVKKFREISNNKIIAKETKLSDLEEKFLCCGEQPFHDDLDKICVWLKNSTYSFAGLNDIVSQIIDRINKLNNTHPKKTKSKCATNINDNISKNGKRGQNAVSSYEETAEEQYIDTSDDEYIDIKDEEYIDTTYRQVNEVRNDSSVNKYYEHTTEISENSNKPEKRNGKITINIALSIIAILIAVLIVFFMNKKTDWIVDESVTKHCVYVDLDLPSGMLWATCNVGAENPWDLGDFFAWGETYPKENYDSLTYKYIDEGSFGCSASFNSIYGYSYSTLIIKNTHYDAATANYSHLSRMPTQMHFEELIQNCDCKWVTSYNGHNTAGYIFASKRHPERQIFLPAAGEMYGDHLYSQNIEGCYWTSCLMDTIYTDRFARVLFFDDKTLKLNRGHLRYSGHTIRAVRLKVKNNDKKFN